MREGGESTKRGRNNIKMGRRKKMRNKEEGKEKEEDK